MYEKWLYIYIRALEHSYKRWFELNERKTFNVSQQNNDNICYGSFFSCLRSRFAVLITVLRSWFPEATIKPLQINNFSII